MFVNRTDMRDDDQTYLSSFRESARFFYLRGKGHLWRFLQNRVRWHVYPRLHLRPAFPDHVDIEACSACNMRCPMCFTVTEQFKRQVKRTTMSFDLFTRIVDECARHGAFSVRLSWCDRR